MIDREIPGRVGVNIAKLVLPQALGKAAAM